MLHYISCILRLLIFIYFFFNNTATTEIYTLFLHDALPIYRGEHRDVCGERRLQEGVGFASGLPQRRVSLVARSEEHTSELQSQSNLVCRLLLEKKKKLKYINHTCLL